MDGQKILVSDCERNLQTVLTKPVILLVRFFFFFAICDVIKVSVGGVCGELAVRAAAELFGVICSKSSL